MFYSRVAQTIKLYISFIYTRKKMIKILAAEYTEFHCDIFKEI